MTKETPPSHPLIRGYLRDLDVAFATLPPSQAHELREQITAHLDELLPADADDQDVAQAISRLGSPAHLAREASLVSTPRTRAQRLLSRAVGARCSRLAGLAASFPEPSPTIGA